MIDFSRFNSLIQLTSYFNSEEKCRRYIRESRWEKDDIVCPFCGQHHCATRKDGSYRCNHCGKNFSVLVGTIFENTKISLIKWFMAMYLISCHKKGISSVQLATDIHVTQKTAWFILHKVRTLFMQDENVILSGTVECDEMYLGGREKNKHASKHTEGTQGTSTKTKTPIFGMTMVWKTEEVDIATGEVKEKVHTYEVAKNVSDTKLYYSALPILEEVQSGQLLYSLTPRYTVSILMFSLDHENIQRHWSNEFRARYSLREQVTHEKLSEAINLVFIELGRFNKSIESLENDKERFYFCIKHMRQFRSMPDEFKGNALMENLFQTVEVESLSANEKKQYLSYMTTERDLINQREFALEKATNAGIEIGMARGLAEGQAKGLAEGEARGEARGKAIGEAKGLAEGKQQSRIEIAKALQYQGIDINVISQCTGLSVEEIKCL